MSSGWRRTFWCGCWLAVIALAAGLGGCGEEATEPNANDDEDAVKPIVKTAERGPVKMTVTADRNRITIAERLTLTIEVFAEEGVDIEMGEPGEKLSQFQIRDFQNRPAEPVEGGRRWTRVYDLDIFLSGEYSIPEIQAAFVDHRQEDPDHPGEGVLTGTIRTEPFTIEVASLLEGEFDPTVFRDISGPVELPVEHSYPWVGIVAAGVVVVVAGGVVVFLLLRRREPLGPEQVVVVPHEWAYDQLRLLVDAQLVEQGEVHEFYFRLSHIVRVYIELRFSLMAPERTTEEFLVEVHRSDVLRADHKTLLGDFLRSCDMVKFARYEPNKSEIELVFDSARDFIEETIPLEVESVVMVGGPSL
ncbi:MAG: hypothetical protein KAV82_11790 [Phycisphaerae bacterium]|nr:hypothetical protein [Phycisphaerae bacterium]